MFHYIYKTTNIINNKYYYGKHSTDNIDDNYIGSGYNLKLAIKKYGRENFIKEILTYCDTESDAYELEELVVTQKEINDHMCYNIDLGGLGCMTGRHHTYETRNNISSKLKGNINCLGYKHTEFAKCNMSKAKIGNINCLGYKHSDETKAKHKDFKHTEEAKRKIGLASKGNTYRKNKIPWNKDQKIDRVYYTKKLKPVTQLDIDNNIIMKWASAIDAEEQGGFNRKHISACCNNKQKTHKGFIWRFTHVKR